MDKAETVFNKIAKKAEGFAVMSDSDKKKFLQRYMSANKYVYNRASYGGLSYGWKPRKKDYDAEHFKTFVNEVNADKKAKMLLTKYPDASKWLDHKEGEGTSNYIRRHGAGK